MGNYLDKAGVIYLIGKVKTLLLGKVDKVEGKGLSTNDYTTEEKEKLHGIAAGAKVNVKSDWEETDARSDAYIKNKPDVNNPILTIQKNGVTVDTYEGNGTDDKIVNIVVPTKTGDLQNTSDFQTKSQVLQAISNAVGDITGIDFQVVSSLPASGVKGTIYLVLNNGAGTNSYDEYIWVPSNQKFEKIGTTDVDLSGYVKKTDMTAVTNSEIDTMFA